MAGVKGKGLIRPAGIYFRCTKAEKRSIFAKSRAAQISGAEYIRCKVLDIPLEHVSPYLRAQKLNAAETTSGNGAAAAGGTESFPANPAA